MLLVAHGTVIIFHPPSKLNTKDVGDMSLQNLGNYIKNVWRHKWKGYSRHLHHSENLKRQVTYLLFPVFLK
jgi:hypothetical protein